MSHLWKFWVRAIGSSGWSRRCKARWRKEGNGHVLTDRLEHWYAKVHSHIQTALGRSASHFSCSLGSILRFVVHNLDLTFNVWSNLEGTWMKPFWRLDGPSRSNQVFMGGHHSSPEGLSRASRLSRYKFEFIEKKETTPHWKWEPKCRPCIMNYLAAAFDFDDQKSKCQMWRVNQFTIGSSLLWKHSHNPQVQHVSDWWFLRYFSHSMKSHVRCRMGLVVGKSSEATGKALKPSPALVS